MTRGSSRARRPTGARNGLTQTMASAVPQVARVVTAAAAAMRPRPASTSAATTRTP